MKKMRSGRLIIVLSLLIFGGVCAGFFATQETRDFRIAKNLDIFFSLFRELNTFYVDEINPDKVIQTSIDDMLKSLDPYTVYYPESEADEFTFMTTGKYGGIGSLVRSGGDYVTISEVYKGFPADLAGIKAGDLLKKVDGVSLKGTSTNNVSDKLKGNPGTDISITVERNGKDMEYKMKREKIVIPPVPYYGMIDSNTGYIRFTTFTQGCSQDIKNALVALKANNPKQIILDLRSNPGGLLTEAVEIVNFFVDSGNEVVSTKGKVKQFDEEFKTTKAAFDDKIPIAILINSGTASAAEIVAGAIQDLDRGIIVGQRSYGKGLVQVTRPLSYNTQLKVTTAKYYIPSGRCVQALDFSHPNADGSVGIIPDSLISEFKTKNGRTVKDGGGITPDVPMLPETLSQVASELYMRNFIFDFATKYYWAHPDIKTPSQVALSDQDYADFRNFLIARKFDYKTVTEQSFNELISNAKKEKYYDLHKDLFNEIEKDITHTLDQDLSIFKPEIKDLLEEEIIGRYFYEEGAIAWTVKNDSQINKAIEILNNKDKYSSILNGSAGPQLITQKDTPSVNKKKLQNKGLLTASV
ncbi:MAG TPA: S41 family peptidase [Bacteroidales bacterium]|nr:S41 family peptidase [Bacteroidales bacterium]